MQWPTSWHLLQGNESAKYLVSALRGPNPDFSDEQPQADLPRGHGLPRQAERGRPMGNDRSSGSNTAVELGTPTGDPLCLHDGGLQILFHLSLD